MFPRARQVHTHLAVIRRGTRREFLVMCAPRLFSERACLPLSIWHCAPQSSNEVRIMKKALFAVSSALTILAAAFFAASSGSADGHAKSKADVTFNKDVAPIFFKNCVECHRP